LNDVATVNLDGVGTLVQATRVVNVTNGAEIHIDCTARLPNVNLSDSLLISNSAETG
jgi:hypothetical protein